MLVLVPMSRTVLGAGAGACARAGMIVPALVIIRVLMPALVLVLVPVLALVRVAVMT